MCVLDACCYCIYLGYGCFILGAFMLVKRLLIIIEMLNDSVYSSLEITTELTAAHITAIIMIFGCITPIILLCGVFSANPDCLKIFLIMEIIFFAIVSSWQLHFILNYQNGKTPNDQWEERGYEIGIWAFTAIALGFEIYTLWMVYSY